MNHEFHAQQITRTITWALHVKKETPVRAITPFFSSENAIFAEMKQVFVEMRNAKRRTVVPLSLKI